jgi:Domain of unknown function (DUF4352)/zinc-ribbon domain
MSEEGRHEGSGRVCSNCGAELPHETTSFCPNCGAAQTPDPDVPTGPPPPTPEPGRISTEYAPGVPPPPPQTGGRSRRWIFFVGGGCIVLLVLALIGFVGCFAVLGSIGEEGSNSSSSSSGPGASKESAVAIGEPVTVGDVTWTITDARPVTQLRQSGVSKQFAKTEQGNYVIVDFDFINNGSESVTLDNESLALLDSQGNESKPSPDQYLYVPENRHIFLERINPGVTRQGEAIFEVAPGASGFQLQAGDTNPFTDENGYVNLGF